MTARWKGAGLAVALLLSSLSPASATPARTELDDARQELDVAQRSLAEVERSVDRAREQVDGAEARLAVASSRLRDLASELEVAERALAAASDAQLEVAAELADALTTMDDQLAEWEAMRETVSDRVAEVWKRGTGSRTGLLVSGVANSEDLHGATVAVRTVQRLVERDREVMLRSRELSDQANAARAEVAARRAVARSAEREAARQRQRVETVLRQQAGLVADIERDRDERQRALASLEGDRVASAMLVQRLQQQVRDLSLALDDILLASVDIPIDAPPPAWAIALPARGRAWAATINVAAAREGIDPRLLAAVAWTESNFTPTAVSHAGAIGMVQLMPGTAAGLGVDPWDPMQNLQGGARYLRDQIARFGSVELGLAAYNAGPGAVSRYGGIPPYAETQLYVLRVLERYERIRAS